MTITQALTYLSVGGSAVVAAALASGFYETQAWFHNRTPAARRLITAATAAALGLAAVALTQFTPPAVLAALQPYFAAFIAAVAPFLGQEIYHKLTRRVPTVITADQQDIAVSADSVTVAPAPKGQP
jgi:hypothetical protein